ncbi:MAG: hypothetical protein MJA82_18260, partial [Clostridia bacterium]|nr:hypothetical protein [Clostridia bacterium]
MIKRKTTIAIVCILLFLSPFIIIDIMRNFNKPKEAAKHEDDPKGPEEIVEIERYYEPLNSKKYDDTEVLDRCLDIIDRYFENLNKKKYEGAMKLINKTSYEYRNIKIDSFKNIIESKYKTLVGYNLKDFKKVGEGLYLCVLRTSNEQLGEEVYSKNDLFEYEEKMIVDINTELISPNGFIKRLDIDENLFKDELIRVEIKKVYKYLSEIIVDTEVTNLLENEDI